MVAAVMTEPYRVGCVDRESDLLYDSHYCQPSSCKFQIDLEAADVYELSPMNSAPYDMRCPVARTLDIVGERWTILILRDLFVGGARKFQDFERSLAGISPNTLSARLKRLEEHGIVERRFYEQYPPRAEYRLTDKGRQLGPILQALLDWGRKLPAAPSGGGRVL